MIAVKFESADKAKEWYNSEARPLWVSVWRLLKGFAFF